MNKERRAAIERIKNQLSELRDDLDSLKDEEQDAFDNMPESLQQSERGQLSEAAIEALDNAVSQFDEIENYLDDASQ